MAFSLRAARAAVAAPAILLLLLAGCGPAQNGAAAPATHSSAGHAHLALNALWSRSLAANADSAPVYLAGVTVPGHGKRPMVYALAGNNSDNCRPSNPVTHATLYAFDAVTGAQRWSRSTSGPSRCTTAAPAAAGNWVYAAGLDGKVHRYAAGTGRETLGKGWPVPVTLSPDVEKTSAALLITGRYLYASTSGFIGDQGHYQGHVVTIDLRSGKSHVFNSLCSNIKELLSPSPSSPRYCRYEQSGLFGRGQGETDPLNHDVYIVSGNGPWNGSTNWGDSILKLNPAGTHLIDAFTPINQAALNASDQDLGSTVPALLPPFAAGGRTWHLLVQGGKGPACGTCNGVALRLLNRDNLSGKGGPGHLGGDLQDVPAPGGCEVLTAPAVRHTRAGGTWAYFSNDCGLDAYHLAARNGRPQLQLAWSNRNSGTTPVIAHGVLYVATSGHLLGYNPSTGAVETQASIGDIHWQYPLPAGGRLYLTDENGRLTAYRITG